MNGRRTLHTLPSDLNHSERQARMTLTRLPSASPPRSLHRALFAYLIGHNLAILGSEVVQDVVGDRGDFWI
jgi:hypothetical protein